MSESGLRIVLATKGEYLNAQFHNKTTTLTMNSPRLSINRLYNLQPFVVVCYHCCVKGAQIKCDEYCIKAY